jgi:hypothetical protein
MASLRILLAIAVAMDLELCQQMDHDTTFVFAPIKKDGYIHQLFGVAEGTLKVCHLMRFLFGLKQPPLRVKHSHLGLARRPRVAREQVRPVRLHLRTWTIFAMIALYVDAIPKGVQRHIVDGRVKGATWGHA